MSEGWFDCPLKYVLWLRHARRHYPSAQWIGLGDDDIFVATSHLVLELRLAAASLINGGPTAASSLWGLITWKACDTPRTHSAPWPREARPYTRLPPYVARRLGSAASASCRG